MTKQDKQKIEAALITAYDDTLKEQEFHLERVAALEKLGNKDYLKNLFFLGAEGLIRAMADEYSPATYQDRQQLLKQNWNEIPSYLRIQQIEDKDIRNRTFFWGKWLNIAPESKPWSSSLKYLELVLKTLTRTWSICFGKNTTFC